MPSLSPRLVLAANIACASAGCRHLLFHLLLQAKNRLASMRRGFGLSQGRTVAVVEGALLVAPAGTLGRIDLSVVIGVDAVEAFVEAAVAVGFGEARKPVVIGLHLFESGFSLRREIGRGQLPREVRLAPF